MARSISTPATLNMIVIGCIPPSVERPFSNGTPARAATSPSPVESITILLRIASRPDLLSVITPATRFPSIMTSLKPVYSCTLTPASISISSIRIRSFSGLMTCSASQSRAFARSSSKQPPSCLPVQLLIMPVVATPPTAPYCSISIVFRPMRAACRAAPKPAGPPPTTRTSVSAATGISRLGSV